MGTQSFQKYALMMESLNVKITNDIKAPHKALLLISIFDLIKNNTITNNQIYINNDLKKKFCENWNLYIKTNTLFQHFSCTPWTPFWHLRHELFWHFQPINDEVDLDNLVGPGITASVGKMRKSIKYAYFDTELYDLLQDSIYRNELRLILFDSYIKKNKQQSTQNPNHII